MKKQRISITFTLALAFFLLSVLILFLFSSLQIFFYFQIQQTAITDKQQVIAKEAASTVSNFIKEKLLIMESFTGFVDLTSVSQSGQIRLLNDILAIEPSFRHIIFLDAYGNILSHVSRLSQNLFNEFLSKPGNDIVEQLKTEDRYIGPVYFDTESVEPLIIIAVPDKNALREIKGILIIEMKLKFMWDLMENIEVGNKGVAYVVDRRGVLIAFKDFSRVLKGDNLSNIKTVKSFIEDTNNTRKSQVILYKGIMNTDCLGTYLCLGTPDWAVVTEMPAGEAYSDVFRMIFFSFLIMLVLALLSGFIGILVARRLALPIIHLTKTASRIADGETELQAKEAGSKENITLATAFNSMTAQLRNKAEGFKQTNQILTEIITKAKEIIVNLNSSTREIEAASQEQTSGANEYASGITEVSATLEELTITAKQITKNVEELVFSNEEIIKVLHENEQQLLTTVSQLEDAGKISSKNTSEIGELGKRSTLINEMVEIIKEVANKTNILSINASIEASRSGESGKGFAVVAAEIRELSKETITYAKNVDQAAKEIHNFLNSIIISSESESGKVIEGGKTVKTVYDSIENLLEKIDSHYTFTQKIDVSIKQQEKGSKQASETMKQMAEIARQSAETARQTLAIVTDIVKLSEGLNNVVEKIKIDAEKKMEPILQNQTGVKIVGNVLPLSSSVTALRPKWPS
ncbi:MAG: methyl-accepting chemotaxis protein [Spirochaetales bacterium]|nr:methyl-accepting chemotaxis protein [Spirochaetales bacterium]